MFNYLDFNQVSDIDRLIMKYVVNNLELVSLMRVRDLAEKTHVSSSTIMRFVERAGFESFSNFKYVVKQEIQRKSSLSDSINTFDVEDFLTYEKTIDDDINALVSRIENANTIYCAGLGSSGIMAEYFQRLISDVGFTVIASKDGYLPMLWNQKLHEENNIIILFSTSGETKEIIQILEIVKDRPPYIISITNGKDNTIAKLSDLNVPYYIQEDRIAYHISMTSQIPVMYLIETIARKLRLHRIASNETPF